MVVSLNILVEMSEYAKFIHIAGSLQIVSRLYATFMEKYANSMQIMYDLFRFRA